MQGDFDVGKRFYVILRKSNETGRFTFKLFDGFMLLYDTGDVWIVTEGEVWRKK
jgi:hypothetical protein